MRHLSSFSNATHRQRLADYLLAQGIPNRILDDELWVVEEDQLPRAKEILAAFQKAPDDPAFASARQTAAQIRKEEAEAEARFRNNFFRSGDLWGRHTLRQIPVTVGIMVVSVLVTLIGGFGGNRAVTQYLYFAEQLVIDPIDHRHEDRHPMDEDWPQDRARSLPPVQLRYDAKGLKEGQLWRLLTPIFLHFSLIHLGFNMMCFYSLAGLLEFRRGAWWLIGFVLFTGIASNVAQFAFPYVFNFDLVDGQRFPGVFAGMSGVCYALFGYLAFKMRIDPEAALAIPPSMIYVMLIWLVACMTGWLGSIANTAHVAGLLAGLVVALCGWGWKQWRRRRLGLVEPARSGGQG